MYQTHEPLIASHAQSPQGFADVVTFVIASQNQHFYRIGIILQSLQRDGLDNVAYLAKHQKRGIAYVRQNAAHSLDLLRSVQSPVSRLRVLVELPSIGIVKAGFILQLVCGQVGCLDRHNLRALGLSQKAFGRTPVSSEALSAKLSTYAHLCASLGTPEDLWNGWCNLIWAKYPQHFCCAEGVSAKHALWCGVEDVPVCEHN